jgi:DNA-binding transcriptional MerR regulator
VTSYSSQQVCAMTGVTYRQLDYWTRTGLVHPSLCEARGSGSRRRWTDEDVAQVRKIRIASDLSAGTLQDCLDKLDTILEELTAPATAAA